MLSPATTTAPTDDFVTGTRHLLHDKPLLYDLTRNIKSKRNTNQTLCYVDSKTRQSRFCTNYSSPKHIKTLHDHLHQKLKSATNLLPNHSVMHLLASYGQHTR
ncbi:hypothetical protein QVD17_38382 [Tagetes erecta]|uniref:Uncharacterized protein n=1 Tax=Tagetes erecta TaxID=13708 RepID=A0AAD8NE82_TARER|nr:hypothetical protein QVD17_38382 [Tagetes erecta]